MEEESASINRSTRVSNRQAEARLKPAPRPGPLKGYNKVSGPPTWSEPDSSLFERNRLLSINNISMRFGARLLFEDVTTTFLAGRRYAITGPNGAGKSTLMRILTGEIEPSKGSVTRPKKIGVLRQDQFAFDAYRVLDTVIMGNAPLWAALQEREDALRQGPQRTHRRRRHAPRRTRRHRRRRGRLHRRERRRHPARRPRHSRRAARAQDERTAGRPEGARAAGAGAVRQSQRAAAG